MNLLFVCVHVSQNEDYRIIMINTFEDHAYHILCEVSCTCVYTYCCYSAKEFVQTERIIALLLICIFA